MRATAQPAAKNTAGFASLAAPVQKRAIYGSTTIAVLLGAPDAQAVGLDQDTLGRKKPILFDDSLCWSSLYIL
jgi:hypothetical protein